MQNYCKTIGALAAASALVAGNAQAEVEYELHAGYSSEYLFRGLDLGDGLVEAGVNAATEWQGFGFSAGAWYGSFEQGTGIPGFQIDGDELDLFAETSKDFGFVTAHVGYIAYLYPGANLNNFDDSGEVYFSLSHDFGFVNAYATYFWDVEGVDNDGYTEVGLSRSFELNQCLNLNLSTNVGYLIEKDDFTAWTSKVSLDWGFAGQAKFSPFVACSVALSDEPDTAYNGSGNELLGGAMISVGF
ncbi:MAG: hypothetical protein RLZZ214_1215 [Verrucomicrobiota bacterium]